MNFLQELAALVTGGGHSNPSMGGHPQYIPEMDNRMQQLQRMARPALPYRQPMAPMQHMAENGAMGAAMGAGGPQQPQLQVQQGGGMQPFGMPQEDDYTPQMAAQPVSFNTNQVSLHGGIQQGGSMRPGSVQGNSKPWALSRYLGY